MRNVIHDHIFLKTKTKAPNVFIGNVGTFITSEVDVALSFSGSIVASDIKSFEIDENNNVSFYIGKDYAINNSLYRQCNLTYFIDLDRYCKSIRSHAFYRNNAFFGIVLMNGLTNISTSSFQRNSNLKCLAVINVLNFGGSVGNNGNFDFANTNSHLYTHPIQATINSGSPDGDIVAFLALSGNVVSYNTNQTAASPINNLAVSAFTSNSISITWSTPPNINGVDWYLVFINNTVHRVVGSAINYVFTGLISNKTYKIKIISVDGLGNDSLFSNEILQQTL